MNDPLIDLQSSLETDINNEIKHMMFYLHAANLIEGLHREELKKFFLKEAHEEMNHVYEFTEILSQCYGRFDYSTQKYDFPYTNNPYELLRKAISLEEEVVKNYVERIKSLTYNSPEIITIRIFYEDQLEHSQKSIWEMKKMIKKFPVQVDV